MTEKEEPVENDYNLKPNQPENMEMECISCGEEGSLRLLLVPDMFFPDVVISTFVCAKCGYKDKQVDQVEASSTGVKLVCTLKKKEDLKRYVIISAGTHVSIDAKDFGVSFTQKEDEVMIVESLLRSVLEKLSGESSAPEEVYTEKELSGLGEYKDFAAALQKSFIDIDLVLTLQDEKGFTRVLPQSGSLKDNIKHQPFEYFTKEGVTMEAYTPEKEEEEEEEDQVRILGYY
ncbi:zinc finger protein [Nematocida sp. AWRm77]|nr:zinc finger protein [Nematocida sp. AWRm77]